MKLSSYLILIGVILCIIALIDALLKKFFRKVEHNRDQVVHLPRYSFILGILMTVFAIMALLYVPRETQKALWIGCWVVLAMGAFVLTNFFWTVIWYDEEGFTYRSFPHGAKRYRYEEIRGQRTFAARSGWNASLYVGEDEVQLYAAMQGVSGFLNKAFFRWCSQKGLDPDTLEYDPVNCLYFPDPEDGEE